MDVLEKGRYRARVTKGSAGIAAAMALRTRLFPMDRDGPDRFDALCRHVLVTDADGGPPLCTFRLMVHPDEGRVTEGYAADFYDLSALVKYPGRMMEMGRFCVDPERRDPDILRIAWAALTRLVEIEDVAFLFGCTSFPGVDPERHADAFALLAGRHVGPDPWRPGRKSDSAVPLTSRRVEPRRAAAGFPPLLRSYLGMGGWVSDHAVVHVEMDTIHVFTGLEIDAIPAARRRLLRVDAGVGGT